MPTRDPQFKAPASTRRHPAPVLVHPMPAPEKLVRALLQGELVTEKNRPRARRPGLLAVWEEDRARAAKSSRRRSCSSSRPPAGPGELLDLNNGTRAGAAPARGRPSPDKVEQWRDASPALHAAAHGRGCRPACRAHPTTPWVCSSAASAPRRRYITEHRVSHAQRLLATTSIEIVEVPMNSGFASMGGFNAAFRQECGCAPRKYRQQHRIAD